MKKIVSNLVCGMGLLSIGTLMAATTAPVTVSTPSVQLNWNPPSNVQSLQLPQFNPALGTLLSVAISVDFSGVGNLAFENLDNQPRTANIDVHIDLAMFDAANNLVLTPVGVLPSVSETLPGFDGFPDYMGPSSLVKPDLAFSAPTGFLNFAAPGDDLSPYIGAGNINYTFEANALAAFSGADAINIRYPAFAQASATVIYIYEPTTECDPAGTATIGYWKNHPEVWPVHSLTLGNVVYSKSQLLTILKTPVRGDTTIALAHQLIAAKLNVQPSLCNESSCIVGSIAAADAFLTAHPVFSKYKGGTSLISVLDAYNNGRLCAPHRD